MRSEFSRTVILTTVLALLSAVAAPGSDEGELTEKLVAHPAPVVNGVLDHGSPSVGMFLTFAPGGVLEGVCTATLIGCRTVLTAAHCICGDDLDGSTCQNRPDLLDPSNKIIFFQHAGGLGVSDVTVHPAYEFGKRSDVAVLRLSEPVAGVRPSRINQVARPPHGTTGAIVGFGLTSGLATDFGLKRAGLVTTGPCSGAPGSTHICWNFLEPLGNPGEDSSICQGDSGGPLFLNSVSGPVVAGVASGVLAECLPPNQPIEADVFVDRAWIAGAAGGDLHREDCGSRPFAGEPDAPILFGSGTLSAGDPEVRFNFEVPPGTGLVGVTLNGALAELNADLFLRHGGPATPGAFDCGSSSPVGLPLEVCGVQNPQSGTWHLLAQRVSGSGPFQATVTLFEEVEDGGGGGGGGGDGDPLPPPGPWLSSSAMPGFEAKVLINDSIPGSPEADCIPETLCVSGALAGRPEIFVKVIGPRPNGFLWTQLSRFTPSRVEVWVRQTSTGQTNYYELAAVPGSSDDVSGLQDREAFSP